MITALYTRIFVERRSERLCHTLFESLPKEPGFGQAVVKILADCSITGDDATQVCEVFYCV